jgi:nitrate/nitrite transport system substrate-binding protein
MEASATRRTVLRTLAGLAGGAAVSACDVTDEAFGFGSAGTGSAKTGRRVRIGFIALTDCAPVLMAQALGFFKQLDLDVKLVKQASWPATRDNLLRQQLDAAHCLFGLPLSVAAGLGGTGTTDLRIAMVLNNNGQAITLDKSYVKAGYGGLAGLPEMFGHGSPTLAMTFPGGTHDLWLRYWLRAAKVDARRVKIIPVPPAQMVANMKVGNMAGFCVGEPWNAEAVREGIGFTHLVSSDLWPDHPEKALVTNAVFADRRREVLADVMTAILRAARWLDDLADRAKAARVLSAPGYVNAPLADIKDRLLGRYELGGGLAPRIYPDGQMRFFRGGAANPPRRAHAIWFLAQYVRMGLIGARPDYTGLADRLLLRDLYGEVATREGIAVPADDMAPVTIKLDGAVFDPRRPDEEVDRP